MTNILTPFNSNDRLPEMNVNLLPQSQYNEHHSLKNLTRIESIRSINRYKFTLDFINSISCLTKEPNCSSSRYVWEYRKNFPRVRGKIHSCPDFIRRIHFVYTSGLICIHFVYKLPITNFKQDTNINRSPGIWFQLTFKTIESSLLFI